MLPACRIPVGLIFHPAHAGASPGQPGDQADTKYRVSLVAGHYM